MRSPSNKSKLLPKTLLILAVFLISFALPTVTHAQSASCGQIVGNAHNFSMARYMTLYKTYTSLPVALSLQNVCGLFSQIGSLFTSIGSIGDIFGNLMNSLRSSIMGMLSNIGGSCFAAMTGTSGVFSPTVNSGMNIVNPSGPTTGCPPPVTARVDVRT